MMQLQAVSCWYPMDVLLEPLPTKLGPDLIWQISYVHYIHVPTYMKCILTHIYIFNHIYVFNFSNMDMLFSKKTKHVLIDSPDDLAAAIQSPTVHKALSLPHPLLFACSFVNATSLNLTWEALQASNSKIPTIGPGLIMRYCNLL